MDGITRRAKDSCLMKCKISSCTPVVSLLLVAAKELLIHHNMDHMQDTREQACSTRVSFSVFSMLVAINVGRCGNDWLIAKTTPPLSRCDMFRGRCFLCSLHHGE